MKTLSPTEARQNLTHWLDRALRGEDIGIVRGGKIIALRRVEVHSNDYALIEYGLMDKEMDKLARNLNRRARTDKGKLWDGTVASLRG